ncbi:MAG: regulatory protein RecX [Candidatus Saccharimonadales bacterium]
MKISKIKRQVKRADRYAVYIDGKYVLSLGESELLKAGLRAGDELTKAELVKLKKRAGVDKALDATMRFVAIRPRSRWEIEVYLRRKGVDGDFKDEILNKLSDSGFIDDESFARSWVANRRLLKPVSKRRLIQELRVKRIDAAIIDKILAEDEVTDIASLEQLIAKKRGQYKDDLKFMQYLARQGYSYQDVKQALNQGSEE